MAIADKLQSILDSKAAIKAAIEEKGVADVGDVLADYPSKIASIQSGGSSTSGWTGHADVEGLKAIGWTDDDIAYYQQHGVNWNEEEDAYHKVPQDNIDLYGVINADNIQDYKDILVYLPKIDTSKQTIMANKFQRCYSLVALPMIDVSAATNLVNMFQACYSLTSVPQLDVSAATNLSGMFHACYSLISVPQLDVSAATNLSNMFNSCYSLTSVPQLDVSAATNLIGMFQACYSLISVPQLDVSAATNLVNMFQSCYSLQETQLKNIKLSLYFGSTSLLSKDSLLYIINNEAAESPITITLSAYCYNKYNADEDVTAALAEHPNVSLASA